MINLGLILVGILSIGAGYFVAHEMDNILSLLEIEEEPEKEEEDSIKKKKMIS